MKKNRVKKFAYLFLTGIIVVSGTTGCKGSESEVSSKTTIYGQVKTVDGNKITIALAKEPSVKNSADKKSLDEKSLDEKSSNEKPSGGGPELTLTGKEKTITVSEETTYSSAGMGGGQAPSDAPSGDTPSGDAPSGDAPSGDAPSGDAPSGDAPSGDAPSDDKQGTQPKEASLEDVTEGVIITATMKDNTVVSIEIRGGMGGESKTGGSETGSIELTGAYEIDGTEETLEKKTIESTKENQNSILVKNAGKLIIANGILKKSGNTSNNDESNFYGVNAILAAAGGSTAAVSDTTFNSDAEGSNAIFATGEDSVVTATNVTINTTGDSSRGLDATYGGTVNAQDVDITTKGAHCAPIATDRGEGTISVKKGTLAASGDGSPCIYSTGKIAVSNVTGTATDSQTAVVEGKNSITLNKCDLSGAGLNGVMLYQSTSGDAAEGTAVFDVTDSKLTSTSEGAMFYVTNTDAEATLTNSTLSFESGILINAAGNNTNNWGQEGANGGNFTLTGVNQTLKGDITCDEISTVTLSLTKGTTYEGRINADQTGKKVVVELDQESSLTVTGDSYVTTITDKDEGCSNIISNGHTIYYDSSNDANSWLNGKTIELKDGGKLTPA